VQVLEVFLEILGVLLPLTASTPAAAFLFSERKARSRESRVMWWMSVVNFASLFLLAASRTRSSALGALARPLRPVRVLPVPAVPP
jgi:hypothetical protein